MWYEKWQIQIVKIVYEHPVYERYWSTPFHSLLQNSYCLSSEWKAAYEMDMNRIYIYNKWRR
jgi:hypothetical protein